MFDHMESIEVGQDIKLNDNLTIRLRNNSHVLGSTNITLTITKPNNQKKTIVYSSDLGSKYNKMLSNYLKDQDIMKKCNLFISEATYCDSDRQISYGMDIKESTALITAAYASIQNGGKVGTGVKSMINNLAGLQTSAKDGSINLNKTAKALKEIAGIDIFTDKTQTAVKTAPQLLDELNKKLENIDIDGIIDSTYIKELILKKRYNSHYVKQMNINIRNKQRQ